MESYSDEDWKDSIRRAIVEKKVPQYLYKFRSWSERNRNCQKTMTDQNDKKCHDREILTDQIVYFASPSSFNDPFDCKIPYRYDLMPRDARFRRLYELAREFNHNCDEKQLRTETERAMANPLFSTDNKVREESYSALWRQLESFGILSFADDYKNILMWSHYADSHRGFCVELDAKLLAEELFYLLESSAHAIDFVKVKYEKELPVVIPSNDTDQRNKMFIRLFSCKSCLWQYENEYRFIYIGKSNLPRYISKKVFSRVIMGCQMTSEAEHEIISTVTDRLPDCKIWKASKSNDEFKLEFAPIQAS